MLERNLSPQAMFDCLAAEHVPRHHFQGRTRSDFEAWQAAARPEVIATLGTFPEKVPLNPEFVAEWQHDGLKKQRWLIDVGPHISAALLVNIPGDLKHQEQRPAILCWHGHGAYGKEPIMGNDSSPELRGQLRDLNYGYGHQMAKAGFVTYAIDWIGGGERNDRNKPHFHSQGDGRDWCNIYYLHATMLGTSSIAINVAHGMAATDFICRQSVVDPARLGVMGLSGGGTMTVWSALIDDRITAAEIICYSDLWREFGIRHTNYCGMQVAPGLYKLVDLPDLQGLLAPKPLLIDIGAKDDCFRLDSAMACYRQLEKIYGAAGLLDRLALDLHAGGHAWGGNKAEAFFNRHLGRES